MHMTQLTVLSGGNLGLNDVYTTPSHAYHMIYGNILSLVRAGILVHQ